MTERVQNDTTMHIAHNTAAPLHLCRGRVVQCDGGDEDVLECSICGRQWTARCTLDDDYN